jgi:dTDP-4-amino-4,6-dideoxygalactose transaminase
MDAKHRRATVSGRAAIGLALQALGVRPGERVLVPTYHCPTMITPIVAAGAVPVFYPISSSGGPNLAWLGERGTVGARAMLVAHYFGVPQAMAGIRQFCDANGLALVEDCAHAFFGASDGRAVGRWGDVAIASLTKFFPVPEGGLIVSNEVPLQHLQLSPRPWFDGLRAIADAIQVGAEHGRLKGFNTVLQALFGAKALLRRKASKEQPSQAVAAADAADELLRPAEPAGAALWITRHVHPGRIAACRRRNYARLARRLSGLRGAYPLVPELPAGAVPYVFPLFVHRAEDVYQPLRRSGIPIFRWDQRWPDTPTLQGDQGLAWSSHVFQLGCHQDLTEDDIERIASTVRLIVEHEAGGVA